MSTPYEQLRQWNELLKNGTITQEEFDILKAELLEEKKIPTEKQEISTENQFVVPITDQEIKQRSWFGKNWAALLLSTILLVIGGYFAFFYKNEPTVENIEEDAIYSEMDNKNDFYGLVQEWNDAHMSKDKNVFSNLFDNTVLFYGTQMSKNACVKSKLSLFKKYPDFYQEIYGDIQIDIINDNEVKCSFIKKVTIRQKTSDYPSYLILKKHKEEWKITTEGDLITDKNLSKKSLNNTSQYVTAISTRVYFYSEPSEDTETNAYFVKGQTAEVLDNDYDEFIKVRFEYKGNVTIGYVLREDVELVN